MYHVMIFVFKVIPQMAIVVYQSNKPKNNEYTGQNIHQRMYKEEYKSSNVILLSYCQKSEPAWHDFSGTLTCVL